MVGFKILFPAFLIQASGPVSPVIVTVAPLSTIVLIEQYKENSSVWVFAETRYSKDPLSEYLENSN